ncbi:MAG TPA: SBBP repeat-containing protein, partial [Anaerolineae bacterium]|nr:SBBP repeat-containing protein [Anaerolineae bacterium]
MLTKSVLRFTLFLCLLSSLIITPLQAADLPAAPGALAAPAPVPDIAQVNAALANSSVMFIENVGQFAEDARFQVRGGNGSLWLADDALWVTLVEPSAPETTARGRERLLDVQDSHPEEIENRQGVNLRLSFPNANPHARLEPFAPHETTVSYFLGNDPDGWRPDVPVWGGVRYVDLYPGIDLEVTSEAGQWVQRLHAQPGADVSQVQLRVEGAEGVEIAGDAGLRLTTAAGDYTLPLLTVADAAPDVLPAISAVKATTFDIAHPFTLSPPHPVTPSSLLQNSPSQIQNQDNPAELLYGTFLGGSSYDYGEAIAIDVAGAAYVTGETRSADFPTTPGAWDTTYNGKCDAFVVKLNAAGSGLAYATFLGGSSYDYGGAIAIDGAGAAYVTGQTVSADFPTTPGAWDTTLNGGSSDAFVVKLDPAGSSLAYATFLGGSNNDDSGRVIAVDGAGAAYVTGSTRSADFPTTPGAWDTTCDWDCYYYDAFVVKLNPAGSGLAYATFLGGSRGGENGYAIAVDGAGAAYVTGATASHDFPTTPGAWDTTYNGGYYLYEDAFVVKLNAACSGLDYGTFLGGGSIDYGYGIAVDGAGAAYVTGDTESAYFPTTPGAFDTTCGTDGYCNR